VFVGQEGGGVRLRGRKLFNTNSWDTCSGRRNGEDLHHFCEMGWSRFLGGLLNRLIFGCEMEDGVLGRGVSRLGFGGTVRCIHQWFCNALRVYSMRLRLLESDTCALYLSLDAVWNSVRRDEMMVISKRTWHWDAKGVKDLPSDLS
jgi:hypothetical protein